MLAVLLEHAGQTVPREELQTRLWGVTNYADPENNLYKVALKVREALRDDVTQPRFIETVQKQGYRFIGELLPAPPSADISDQILAAAAPVSAEKLSEPLRPRNDLWPKAAVVLFSLVLVLAAGLAIYIYRHRPLASSQDKIAIGEFQNTTGDPDFDLMLTPPLRVKLQESPYLSLLRDQTFRAHLNGMPNPESTESELHACAAGGARLLLRGQIERRAPGYQILLTAWRCSDAKRLTTQEARANSQVEILPALDTVAMQMRRRLGEPDGSLQKFNVPQVQATTGSFGALKAFSQGYEKVMQGHESDAVADFKLAVDLDPQFALAYAALGAAYYNAGQITLSRRYFQDAFNLRGRTSDHERLVITAHYYAFGTREILRAIQAYALWHSIYPSEMAPANNLAAAYNLLGEPEKAVEPALAAVRLDPTTDTPYATLARAYLTTRNYTDANALCNDPVRRKSHVLQFHETCYVLAYVLRDDAGMQREMDWVRGNAGESTLLENAAWIAMSQGKLAESRRLFSEAKENALQHKLVEMAAIITADEAFFEADLGLPEASKKLSLEALRLSPESATVQSMAALALARSGNVSAAEVEAGKAAAQSPSDTILNSGTLASVRAAVRLQRHDPEGAIKSLEEARPFDFNITTVFAPAYYRGLAFLQNKDPHAAAKEFARVLEHQAMVPHSPYVGLSQLELGRSLQLAGDAEGASRNFDAVAVAWKDADPDFPPLRQLHAYQSNSGARNR